VNDVLIEKTRKFWEERYRRNLSEEEVYDILNNLRNFYDFLNQLDFNPNKGGHQDERYKNSI
jgi:hypothetical protein